jgi:hypothetical protein
MAVTPLSSPRVPFYDSSLRAAPDYADATFNLALLLQRNNKHAEAYRSSTPKYDARLEGLLRASPTAGHP